MKNNFDIQISTNFKLSEFFVTNQDFSDFGTMPRAYYLNLVSLVETILQPLRNFCKRPVLVTSCYRPAILNALVGGVVNSRHLYAAAADIAFYNPDHGYSMYRFLSSSPYVGELIINYERNYIHVSLKDFNQ